LDELSLIEGREGLTQVKVRDELAKIEGRNRLTWIKGRDMPVQAKDQDEPVRVEGQNWLVVKVNPGRLAGGQTSQHKSKV